MKYILGIAFVGSFLQGNFELSIIIALFFGIVYFALSSFRRINQGIVFSKFSEKAIKDLGSNFVLVYMRGVDYPDPVGLIYNQDKYPIYIISTNVYGSDKFRIQPMSNDVCVVVSKPFSDKIPMHDAIIKIEDSKFSGLYKIQDIKNWILFKKRFEPSLMHE